MIAIAQIASSWMHPETLQLLDVNKLLLSHFSEHPTHLHVLACQRFSACEKRSRMSVRTHISHALGFSFYYTYLNVWIFKSKQANTIQHYNFIHAIVKICNDNCSKPRQHRISLNIQTWFQSDSNVHGLNTNVLKTYIIQWSMYEVLFTFGHFHVSMDKNVHLMQKNF